MKKNLKKSIILFFCILLFINSYSQVNYLPGYVITQKGDTIHGLIDYRNWVKSPNRIDFKADNNNELTSFSPIDIKEFRVKDELYVSGIVHSEISNQGLEQLDLNPMLQLRTDTTFLQTVFKGTKSLYSHTNKEGNDNFYIKKDSLFELLAYKKFLKLKDGYRRLTESKVYLGQLKIYLDDCDKINSKLKSTRYNQKSLNNLFNYYYKCSNTEISFRKEKDLMRIEFGAMTGLSFTNLKFSSYSKLFDYLVGTKYSLSVDPTAGIFLNLATPRNRGKWSLNNELLFNTYTIKGTYKHFGYEYPNTITNTEFGFSYLKYNMLIRYKYSFRSIALYVNGGMSNGLAIRKINNSKKEYLFDSGTRLDEDLGIKSYRTYEQGFILGSGIDYRKMFLELRYENGNGMSNYLAVRSNVSRMYVLVGIKMK